MFGDAIEVSQSLLYLCKGVWNSCICLNVHDDLSSEKYLVCVISCLKNAL